MKELQHISEVSENFWLNLADFVLSFFLVFWEKAGLAAVQNKGLAFQVRGLDAEWRVLTFLLSEGLGFELNIFWIIF